MISELFVCAGAPARDQSRPCVAPRLLPVQCTGRCPHLPCPNGASGPTCLLQLQGLCSSCYTQPFAGRFLCAACSFSRFLLDLSPLSTRKPNIPSLLKT